MGKISNFNTEIFSGNVLENDAILQTWWLKPVLVSTDT